MEVIKFRIKNYKSIVDSNDCYFSKGLTILAGKNESGKTSILEALEDFHENNEIREEAKSINSEEDPEISVTFSLTSKEINEIFGEIGFESSVSKKTEISLRKSYGEKKYILDLESRKALGLELIYFPQKKIVLNGLGQLKKIVDGSTVNLAIPSLDKTKTFKALKTEIKSFQTNIQAHGFSAEEKNGLNEKAEAVIDAIDQYFAREKLCTDFIEKFVSSKLPYFILFSSFEDEFPQSIDVSALENDEWAKDLQEVSQVDIKKIKSTNIQERGNHERAVNIDFTDKFKQFWTQDAIKLEVKRDGEKVNFWIVENDKQYYPSQRSKGQQWYLSFYVKIVARIRDGKPNIILIDEPGLYLHAKAQKDLLKVLREHGSNYPVLFSTHSPYLIEPENLEAVRLVEKKDNVEGSKILGKIHAHNEASKETLTPVLTAIGLGVNDSILNIDQKKNVVVEGPADVFYLQAFKKLSSSKTNINFINGGGAPNMGFVGTILEGWGAEVLYLFDNDSGKDQGEKRLESFHVSPDLIKAVTGEEGDAIEDILSIQDFKKFVLGNEKAKYTTKSSAYVSKQKKDKVLLARLFLQKVSTEKIELDDESKERIKKLLAALKF